MIKMPQHDYDYEAELYRPPNPVGVFVAGLLIGGLAGAVMTLMLAPQSGAELRSQLRDRTLELRDQVRESAEEARERGEEALSQARDKVRQVSEDLRAKAEDLQERGQEALEEQKERVSSVFSSGKKAGRKVLRRR
jgi:gas vesicle protein